MISILKRVLLAVSLFSFASVAGAGLVATLSGTDCVGAFGQAFADCKIPTQYDQDQSPIIIKIKFFDNETIESIDVNSALFPTVDGSEFTFTHTGLGTGTWTYKPGLGDPGITFFVAQGKDGQTENDFNLFSTGGLADTFEVPSTCGKVGDTVPCRVSHLSFYDTDGGQLPEPATLLLFGLGAAGFSVIRRRRR